MSLGDLQELRYFILFVFINTIIFGSRRPATHFINKTSGDQFVKGRRGEAFVGVYPPFQQPPLDNTFQRVPGIRMFGEVRHDFPRELIFFRSKDIAGHVFSYATGMPLAIFSREKVNKLYFIVNS